MSLAISDVVYRRRGLPLSPMPLLSKTSEVYLSASVWLKSFVWRCHVFMKPPKPMIHCEVIIMSVRVYLDAALSRFRRAG